MALRIAMFYSAATVAGRFFHNSIIVLDTF